MLLSVTLNNMNEYSKNKKRQQKRLQIIHIAARLFVQLGIQGTSMQLLAKKADMATGSLYNYFDNKETLIREIYQHYVDEEKAYFLVGYDVNQPLYDRLFHIISRSLQFIFDNPDGFQFKKLYLHSPGFMTDVQGRDYYADHPLEQIALEGQAQGIFKPLSLDELFYFTHAGATGYISWKLFSKASIEDADITHLVDLCWDTLCLHEKNHA